VAPLGAGGMGEVYRARDTRLDRTVAIKVLPSGGATSPEQRQRLDREAHAIAALSHPHICSLHDIGHQDGIDYLVMEYLEGETLATRLAKGPLPLDQALRYAVEIADALDKAHRSGIVHRDLKPGNVMVTKAGTKLVDFGLAKISVGVTGPAGFSALATSPAALTAEGTLLGTLQYMAPEQLEGKEADAKSDLWAFGCVLYEMLTGKKAFAGTSQASVIAAILDHDPPSIATQRPGTPPALDHLVKTCLAKDPDERRQSAHDVRLELTWIATSATQATVSPGEARRVRWAVLTTSLVALIAAAVIGLVVWPRFNAQMDAPPLSITRSTVSLPAAAWLSDPAPALALSPDGTLLAYAGAVSTDPIRLRRLDQLDVKPIPGTEGGGQPCL
jgi:serine/threonine protein kinase